MTDFKAKMHQIRFRLELRPRPRWGSLQRSLRPPSWIWGPLRGRERGWAGKRRERGRERGGKGSGGEGKGGPQVTVEPGPLRALLRHCVQPASEPFCDQIRRSARSRNCAWPTTWAGGRCRVAIEYTESQTIFDIYTVFHKKNNQVLNCP